MQWCPCLFFYFYKKGEIDLEEAKLLCKKFDGEFPHRFAKEFFDYISVDEPKFGKASACFEQPKMDLEYFMHLADRFRSPHIWQYENGLWSLRHTPFEGESLCHYGAPTQGGDKAAINTAALQNPRLLGEIAHAFGSQCVVLSVQAKRHQQGWEAYYDNGREHSGKDALEWIRQAESLGVGEILVTSVDQEGRQKGMDKELIAAVRQATSLPMIAAGGVGQWEDIASAAHLGAEAVAVGSILHYQKATVPSLKQQLLSCGVEVRPWDI